jgi:DNA-binding response OmpR family regulator
MAAKVLVVEDDTFLASAYHAKLEKSGYIVQISRDGEVALVDVKEFKPDIILLDLLMPGKDGFDFLAEVKNIPGAADIPVIVSSNLDQSDAINRAMALGAKDYIVKSAMSLDELTKKIEKILNTANQ